MTVPVARLPDEIMLEAAQKRVTQGELADRLRKHALVRLHAKGMTQRELAERLTRASLAAGGGPVSENAVFKMLNRIKRANGAIRAPGERVST